MSRHSHSRQDVSDPYSEHYDPSSPYYDATRDPSSGTYIDRRDTSQTGDEAEQAAEARVDREVAQGTFLDRLMDLFNHGDRVQDTYNEQMNARAAELVAGVQTRPSPIMMCANYMATPHPQLKTMVTEDVNPDEVGNAGDLWISAGNAMTRFQSGVASAINNSEADWQGSAGDSARTFMAQVGNWVGDAGQSAQLAGTQTNLQASALAEAKRSMPEPVDFDLDAANADLQSERNPFELIRKLNDYQARYDAQQAAHERAANVVGTYDSGLSGASTMPAFGPPPTLSASSTETPNMERTPIGTTNPNTPNTNDSIGTNTPPSSSDPDVPGGNPSIPATPGPNGPNSPSNPNGPNGPGGPDSPNLPGGPNIPNLPGGPDGPGGNGTTPSGDLPGLPGLPGPGPFPVGPGPGGGGSQFGQNPVIPPLPVGSLPGPNGGDLERGRGSGPGGRFGGGPGAGGFGGGPGAGGGPGSQGTAGRGPGVGGMGPGGVPAEGGAVRGGAVGAGGRGGAGAMGGAPFGGRRGEGDDDDEHRRPSFLVEGDPDAVFGTDQMTAPPVIGE